MNDTGRFDLYDIGLFRQFLGVVSLVEWGTAFSLVKFKLIS